MCSTLTTRTSRPGQIALAAVVFCALTLSAAAAPLAAPRGQEHAGGGQRPPAPQPRASQGRPNQFQNRPNNGGNNGRPHLGDWMNAHRTQPLDQQQRALEQEPGFRQLRPEVQQRMRDRLTQLNNMTPERRQQAIARTEAMERLNPQQRQQVSSAAGQLGSLPEDRRRAVARAFHDLRDLPEGQRQNYLNSPQFRGQFSDHERGTLNNLLEVSPYLPIQQRPTAPGGPPPLF